MIGFDEPPTAHHRDSVLADRNDKFRELVKTEKAQRAEEYAGNAIAARLQADAGNSREEVTTSLLAEFMRLEPIIGQDSAQHYAAMQNIRRVEGDATSHVTAKGRGRLEAAFRRFTQAAYDEQGNLRRVDTAEHAHQLARLYEDLKAATQLHDPEWPAGALLRVMVSSDKWKEAAPQGLSASRIPPGQSVEAAMREALTGQPHRVEATPFIQPPAHYEVIEGLRFPSHKIKLRPDDPNDFEHTHLVTRDGYLIDLTDELRGRLSGFIRGGGDIGTFKVEKGNRHLGNYINPGEFEDTRERQTVAKVRRDVDRLALAEDIDGAKPESFMSLVCMDVDLMTGLRMDGKDSELSRVMKFMAAHKLPDFTALMPEWKGNLALMNDHDRGEAQSRIRRDLSARWQELKDQARAEQPDLLPLLEKAQESLVRMMPRVAEYTDEALSLKSRMPSGDEIVTGPILTVRERQARGGDIKNIGLPRDKPDLYATQGGMASGKSGLEEVARRECGEHLVVASLDGVRGKAAEYGIYIATENHNDDYKKFEQFGKAVRTLTIERARAQGLDLFIDATGVPFKGNYDKIFTRFGDSGYRRTLLAAAAPLYVDDPVNRKQLFDLGLTPSDSLGRGGERLKSARRAVLPALMVKSHKDSTLANCNAARAPMVDRFLMEDYTGAYKEEYALSYTVDGIKPDELKALLHKRDGELQSLLAERGMVPAYVKPPRGDAPRSSDFKVVRYDEGKDTYRIEVITDMEPYVANRQKGLLNREAVGPEALLEHRLDCDFDGHFRRADGRLRLDPPRAVGHTAWPHFSRMAAREPSQPREGMHF